MGAAFALDACTAADIRNQELKCDASSPCTIVKQYTVADQCVLDFEGQDVVLAPSAALAIGYGHVTLRAHDLTMQANASSGAAIHGRGLGSTAPTNHGGSIDIAVSGDLRIEKSGTTRARIEVSAKQTAGDIVINAAGDVTIAGRLQANQEFNASAADGGKIEVNAGKNIVSAAGSQIFAAA